MEATMTDHNDGISTPVVVVVEDKTDTVSVSCAGSEQAGGGKATAISALVNVFESERQADPNSYEAQLAALRV